ncbi:MAG: ribosome biogenesis GTP-binding protein YihA/YsxC [Evtepia gabavorous]
MAQPAEDAGEAPLAVRDSSASIRERERNADEAQHTKRGVCASWRGWQTVPGSLPQIAFAGRSNVGKSSVINRLLNRKNFARVGSAPGKTTHINYFRIDRKVYFVDLPGYGYAKVSKQERARWGRLIEQWFADASLLTLGILLVDLRHKPTADDCVMAQWFKDSGKPFVVVANKQDKIKKSEWEPNLARIRETLALDAQTPVISFSAEKGLGKEELLGVILDHISADTAQE